MKSALPRTIRTGAGSVTPPRVEAAPAYEPTRPARTLGAELGMSAERVRQLEQHALETLYAATTQAPTSS